MGVVQSIKTVKVKMSFKENGVHAKGNITRFPFSQRHKLSVNIRLRLLFLIEPIEEKTLTFSVLTMDITPHEGIRVT
jgi:hypothetical protein